MFLTQSFWVYLNIYNSLAKKEMEPGKTKKAFKNTVKMNRKSQKDVWNKDLLQRAAETGRCLESSQVAL